MKAIRTAMAAIALLAGASMAQAQCVGDCNDNGTVAVNELVLGVNIALDREELSACDSFDSNNSQSVEVNELVTGVNNLLRGCGPTPTATTPGSGPTLTPTPTEPTTGNTPTPTVTGGTGGSAACTFGTADSSLRLCFLGTCVAPLGVSGALEVQCGGAGSGQGGGDRNCECIFGSFDPVFISSVGYACVEEPEGTTCPAGTQDCGGTESVNVDLIVDTDVGTCSGNADCAAKCDTYCAGLNPVKTRFSSGCESFCQSGTRVDQPCECDVLGGATCAGGSTTDCPAGSCEGKDNETDIDCHCQCVDEAFGANTAAGALRCRLPTAIRVEAALPCDNAGVLVRLPPLCAPFTSGEASGILEKLNETQDPLEFDSLIGNSTTCAAIDGGDASDLTLVANLGFFDSTIGDIISQLTINCQ